MQGDLNRLLSPCCRTLTPALVFARSGVSVHIEALHSRIRPDASPAMTDAHDVWPPFRKHIRRHRKPRPELRSAAQSLRAAYIQLSWIGLSRTRDGSQYERRVGRQEWSTRRPEGRSRTAYISAPVATRSPGPRVAKTRQQVWMICWDRRPRKGLDRRRERVVHCTVGRSSQSTPGSNWRGPNAPQTSCFGGGYIPCRRRLL